MFEDKHMFKFVGALLGFASIIIAGPIVPIISLIIEICNKKWIYYLFRNSIDTKEKRE